jgi:phage terminase large subunit GpA-like protein
MGSAADAEWVAAEVAALTDDQILELVSEWAERKRYIPKALSPLSGFYSWDVNPALREIADCMSVTSPVREFDFMKGVQIGATVGVFENTIGYLIDHVKSSTAMLLTADAELATLRLESFIMPMVDHSGLDHLIQSSDEKNSRRTGRTSKRLEWLGGGFLLPFGAKNADKLRSTSIQYLLEDEVDAFPETVGKDGDPQKLAEARCKAYYKSRKIGRISTPLLKHKSRIEKGFKLGDQRYYNVPCKHCGGAQVLTFQGEHKDTGEAFGLVWSTDDDGHLVAGSVRYLCKHCGGEHVDADKSYMLARGEWVATARPSDPARRSYHLSALYSPAGMFPWDAIVREWLEAWDTDAGTPRDIGKLQEFYNNNLGQTFEIRAGRVHLDQVSAHKRHVYQYGEIPNAYALQHSGSKVLFLTCQIDVHKNNLAVAVMGWTSGSRCYLVDYWRVVDDSSEPDCTDLTSPVWARAREIIEESHYTADDGTGYGIALTLVDAGYANDTVSAFCAEYEGGVYPILGRDRPAKAQAIREFAEFKTQAGQVGFRILVDHYKDRMAPVLRREWYEESGPQKPYHFNAPRDAKKAQLKELTVESRVEKTDDKGAVSYGWHRPNGAKNELWDLLGYGYAAVELIMWSVCVKEFEREEVDAAEFWAHAESEDGAHRLGRVDPPPVDR